MRSRAGVRAGRRRVLLHAILALLRQDGAALPGCVVGIDGDAEQGSGPGGRGPDSNGALGRRSIPALGGQDTYQGADEDRMWFDAERRSL